MHFSVGHTDVTVACYFRNGRFYRRNSRCVVAVAAAAAASMRQCRSVGIDLNTRPNQFLQILVLDVVGEEAMQEAEGRAQLGIVLPAVAHHLEHLVRTGVRPGQSLIFLDQLDHLGPLHVVVGWRTVGKHFPQRNSERPHVAGMRECAVVETLGGIPEVIRAVGVYSAISILMIRCINDLQLFNILFESVVK